MISLVILFTNSIVDATLDVILKNSIAELKSITEYNVFILSLSSSERASIKVLFLILPFR